MKIVGVKCEECHNKSICKYVNTADRIRTATEIEIGDDDNDYDKNSPITVHISCERFATKPQGTFRSNIAP